MTALMAEIVLKLSFNIKQYIIVMNRISMTKASCFKSICMERLSNLV